MNGFGMKLACNIRLLCIVNVNAAASCWRSPVQPAKIFPELGLAVTLNFEPTASNFPFKFGLTAPPPLTVRVNGLTTIKVTRRDTVADTLPLVSVARTRMVFGPGTRSVTVADQVFVPVAAW